MTIVGTEMAGLMRFDFPSQEKIDSGPKRDIDGMGVAEIKYGDSVCFIMHVSTGLWLSYLAPDAKTSRLGPLKRRVRVSVLVLFCPKRLKLSLNSLSRLQLHDYNNFVWRIHL